MSPRLERVTHLPTNDGVQRENRELLTDLPDAGDVMVAQTHMGEIGIQMQRRVVSGKVTRVILDLSGAPGLQGIKNDRPRRVDINRKVDTGRTQLNPTQWIEVQVHRARKPAHRSR